MNYSILTDERVKKNGLLTAFTLKKTYIWYAVLAAIFFLSVFIK